MIGRGIERSKIFRNGGDREDLQARLAKLCEGKALSVYAWALTDNHFHLLVGSGKESLSHSMPRLLTGYAVNYNSRHSRYGHLFQNRYKSILREEDPYLLELNGYIFLNPLRGRVVKGLKELRVYPWTGPFCDHGEAAEEVAGYGKSAGIFWADPSSTRQIVPLHMESHISLIGSVELPTGFIF